jgi:ATP synthase protein I
VPEPNSVLRFGRSFALFWDFVGTVLAGTVVGWFVDRWFGTEPYATMSFLILGVIGGFVRLVSSLRRLDRLDHDE